MGHLRNGSVVSGALGARFEADGFVPKITGATSSGAGARTLAVNNDGTLTLTGQASQFWNGKNAAFNSAQGALYEAKVTNLSGLDPAGAPVGIYVSLGTSRSWAQSNIGVASQFRLDIRGVGSGVILATADFTLNCTA